MINMADGKRPPYPERWEDAYQRILNGVSNNESKVVTVLSMDEIPYSYTELYDAVRQTVNTDDFGKSTPFGYCEQSLEDIGAVATSEITTSAGRRGVTGYRLTEFGKTLQPLMAYQLKAVTDAEHTASLYESLGSTSSSGKQRAPAARAAILDSIASTDDATVLQVSDDTGHPLRYVDQATDRMAEETVIKKRKPGAYNEQSNYIVVDADPENYTAVRNMTALTDDVVTVLEEGHVTNSYELSEELDYDNIPEISRVLSGLTDQGLLEQYPLLELTPKGEESLHILRNIKSFSRSLYDKEAAPPEIPSAWNLYNTDRTHFNNTYSSVAWNAYRRLSSRVHKTPKEEGIRRIEEIVKELECTDTPTTTKNITEVYNNRYHELSRDTIGERLNQSDNLHKDKWEEDRRQKIYIYKDI